MTFINKVCVGLAGATFTALLQVSAAQAGVLGGSLFSTGGGVWASILGGEAGLTSHLSLYSPRSQYIGNNREVGKVVYLGQFAVGQELLFGIFNGNTFFMGPGSRNADGVPHATVNFVAPGVADVGFEDVWGGGDWDFNDVTFRFQGAIAAAPPQPPLITSLTSDLTVRKNTLFDFAATAKDGDVGDVLTFNWDFNNDGLYDDFTGSSGQWSFSSPGDYTVSLQVVDRYGLSDQGSFRVTAVPEPTSLLSLFVVGSLGVGSMLKRKQ